LPFLGQAATVSNVKNAAEILHYLTDRSKQKVRDGDTPLLAVFDLDSTLFEVSPRSQAILRDLAAHPKTKEKYPEEMKKLSEIKVQSTDWGILVALKRSQICATLDFFETVRRFWVENFFTNNYLHYDQLYDGALEFVQQLHRAGARIKYLTGRDQHRMGEGTLKTLRQWNLPLEDQKKHLILKPHKSIEDARYKTDKLLELAGRYDEIWFFENEPTIIETVCKEAPQIKVVFVDTVHSGKAKVPKGLPSIKNSFQD